MNTFTVLSCNVDVDWPLFHDASHRSLPASKKHLPLPSPPLLLSPSATHFPAAPFLSLHILRDCHYTTHPPYHRCSSTAASSPLLSCLVIRRINVQRASTLPSFSLGGQAGLMVGVGVGGCGRVDARVASSSWLSKFLPPPPFLGKSLPLLPPPTSEIEKQGDVGDYIGQGQGEVLGGD